MPFQNCLIFSSFGSWVWEHTDTPIGFSSWADKRPNTHPSNSDDCTLMDPSNREYDWKDLICSEGHIGHHPVSFICQRLGSPDEKTTATTTSTTEAIETTIFPGKGTEQNVLFKMYVT